MRYETYETRARFSYRAVLITLTSHLVVIDFRQGRLSTAEQANAFIDLGLSGIPRNGPRKRACADQSDQLPACRLLGSYRPESDRVGQLLPALLKLALMRP